MDVLSTTTTTTTTTTTLPLISDDGSIASRSTTMCTISSSNDPSRLLSQGRIILFFLAFVYGSLNVSMRLIFARPDPPTASASSTIQGWFSVLCYIPLLKWQDVYTKNKYSKIQHHDDLLILSHTTSTRTNKRVPDFWRFAFELALFNFGTQALINISLVATSGARASFLVQMSVVVTPVVSALLFRNKINKHVWVACFVALAGLFILSYSPSTNDDNYNAISDIDHNDIDSSSNMSNRNDNSYYPSISLSLTWGDWCCLAAAIFWSYYICRLSALGGHFDETTLQFVKSIILAVLYTLWMLISNFYQQYGHLPSPSSVSTKDDNATNSNSLWKGWRDPIGWVILFYTALGPCTIADVCQQKAQASVPAAETNVILSLEPVFTTILGFIIIGEIPSSQELVGGVLIMIASILASCHPSR